MKVAILTCALLVAGCKSIDASSQKVMQEPFEVNYYRMEGGSSGGGLQAR